MSAMDAPTTTTTTTTTPKDVHDLGLEFDDDEEFPCRLIKFPVWKSSEAAAGDDGNGRQPTSRIDMVSYGGDDGVITSMSMNMTAESTKDDSNDASSTQKTMPSLLSKSRIARTFDESVRAVAVSHDGKRVAVGFQTGRTTILQYDDYDGTSRHPFCRSSATTQSHFGTQDSDSMQDLDFGDGLSQTDEDQEITGPHLQAPVRDMLFLPFADSKDSYFLAIASEHSFCIVNATSSESIREFGRALEHDCEEHHFENGIRSLAYNHTLRCLATLSMDGRVCLWDLQAAATAKQWKLAHQEKKKCIPQADTGETFGADPWDRSCRPLFITQPSASSSSDASVYLLTPGQTQPVIRRISREGNNGIVSVQELVLNKTSSSDASSIGHVEPITQLVQEQGTSATATAFGFVSSGRDGNLVQWTVSTPTGGDAKQCSTTSRRIAMPNAFAAVDLQFASNMSPSAELQGRLMMVSAKAKCHMLNVPAWKPPSEKAATKPATSSKLFKDIDTNVDDLLVDSDDEEENEMDMGAEDSMNPQFDTQDAATIKAAMKGGSAPKKTVRFVDDEADEDDDGNGDDYGLTQTPQSNPEEGLEDIVGAPSDIAATTGDQLTQDVGDNTEDGDNGMANILQQDDEDEDGELGQYQPLDGATTRSVHGRHVMTLPPQPPFAPSATPLDLPRRFMCWNHIGAITLAQGDEDLNGRRQQRNIVDITFTDSAFRRPISFTDNQGFILGSLGEDGGIFATDTQDPDDEDHTNSASNDMDDDMDNQELDDVVDGLNISERTKAAVRRSRRRRDRGSSQATGSSIYFHRFETFGSQRDKDWYLTLPSGERALGAASGKGWAAVATSRRYLRFFTSGGNQGVVVCLPGNVVSMVGRSQFLAVVYHTNSPLMDGTQQLAYRVYDAVHFKLVATGPVSSISDTTNLYWLGFSNDAALMIMDSGGMLSMLIPTNSDGDDGTTTHTPHSWELSPALDTRGLRKSDDDQFWPVTVQDGKLVCVPLKGGNQFPDAARKPITTSMGLKLPLATRDNWQSTQLEELSVRSNLALGHKRTMHELTSTDAADDDFEREYTRMCAQVDKVTLKLFQTVVQAGKLERGLDLLDRLHLEKSYDIAATIAGRHDKLVDMIEAARDDKFADPEDDDVSDYGSQSMASAAATTTTTAKTAHVSPISDAKRLFEYSSNPMQSNKKQRRGIF